MKRTNQCPKCQSTDVIADAKAVDRGHGDGKFEMTLATFRKPEALFFKGEQQTTASAWVCGACGFVEFYAKQPKNLRLAGS